MLTVLVLVAELPSQRDVPYIVFPLLIWAALRFGPRGASLSLLLVSGLTVLNTAHNTGPFVRESITDSLLSTQLFLATAAVSSLILAAVTAERATAAAALRANEERLRSVVRCMTEGLIVRDSGGVITECNAVAERLIGRSRDRLLGRRPGDVIGPAVDERGEPLTGGQLLGDRALTDGASESGMVAQVTRPDGTAAWVSASSGPVRDAAGDIAGVVTSLSDITSRREAEQRLVASERDTRTLAEEQSALRRIATQVAAEAPPHALFAQVTEEVGRLLGAPSARVVRYEEDGRATIVGGWTEDGDGLPVGSSVPLDGETVLARVRRSGRVERIEGYEGIGGELAERLRARGYRASVAAPVRVAGRVWGALVASARDPRDLDEGAERRLCDVAELVAQALANADAREMLAASRARIVEAGDAERRRLERNLHDGAQQRLVALAVQLRLIRAAIDGDLPVARGLLDSAITELREALEELRELARGIHPAMLTNYGLERAVAALAVRSPVPVEIAAMPEERLPPPVEVAAYYIMAEAITNVAKYAAASHITVTVDQVGRLHARGGHRRRRRRRRSRRRLGAEGNRRPRRSAQRPLAGHEPDRGWHHGARRDPADGAERGHRAGERRRALSRARQLAGVRQNRPAPARSRPLAPSTDGERVRQRRGAPARRSPTGGRAVLRPRGSTVASATTRSPPPP